MPKWLVSRSYYTCDTAIISAKDEDAALEKARENGNFEWKNTGGDDSDDALYQVEWREED